MLDDIEKWIGILTAFGMALWSHFRHAARIQRVEEKHNEEALRMAKFKDEINDDVDKLKDDRTRTNTMLENLVRMQEENRLDVKAILQQIATLHAHQGQSMEQKD